MGAWEPDFYLGPCSRVGVALEAVRLLVEASEVSEEEVLVVVDQVEAGSN